MTDTKAKNAKPREKTYKLGAGKGMYLEVTPKGGKYWRYKYRFGGKEKRLALGVYPDASFKKAGRRHDEARKLLEDGIDPSEVRRAQKLALADSAANSFEVVAREWYAKQKPLWSGSYCTRFPPLFDDGLVRQ